MTHTEFISILKEYGINVVHVIHGYDHSLEVNEIRCGGLEQKYFGYYVGGTHYPVIPYTDKIFTDADVKSAVNYFIQMQNTQYKQAKSELDYWDITDYLKAYQAKSKVLTDGIKKVLTILKEEFNTMHRIKNKKL